MEIVYQDESFSIIGACFQVYNEVGCGFDEPIYQECLEIEFGLLRYAMYSSGAPAIDVQRPGFEETLQARL